MKKVAIFVVVVALFLTSIGIAYATLGNKTITITYRNISIYINGVKKLPSNEPFIYNSSTYVPLRFVSEALDKEVKWDGTTNRIDINDKSASTGEWKKVIEFTGGDSVKTQPFTIHSKIWKIIFTGQQIGDYGAAFDFYVYKVGEDNFIDSATGTFKDKKLNNETYIYIGNSNFYLEISALFCTYDITIYEQ